MSAQTARQLTSEAPGTPAETRAPGNPSMTVPAMRGTPVVETQRPFDVSILVCVMCLVGLGIVMVYSASIGVADMRFDDPNRYLRSHLKHAFLSVLALCAGLSLNYQVYRRHVYAILGVSLFLLTLTVLGFGINRGHSTRWIGPSFFQFQPSELAKLAFVIYLAYSLEKKLTRMETFAIGFLPHLLVCVMMMILCLAQPDLGTCILLGMVMFSMLFVGGTRVSYIALVLMIAIPAAAGYIARSSRRLGRVLSWVDPWADRFESGYQTVNALTSLGSGGIFGMGLGEGRQKMGFLTQSWTDFIFSSIGEELGLLGTGIVLLLFVVLCARGFRAAWRAPDKFGRYLAFGITVLIGAQAAFNMAVAVGLLPTKGLNLPFVSGGGSSLLVTCFAAGILLNISRYAESPEAYRPLRKVRKPRKRALTLPRRSKAAPKKPRRAISQKSSGARPFVRPTGGGSR